jgi:uncharacterized SAM-binding protein YcdF (DUF218 family)
VFYTTLKSLILPPGGIILVLALAFLLVRGVLGRLLLFVALSVLTLMSLPVVGGKLMEGLETYPAITASNRPPGDAQAILVLGSGRYRGAPEYGGDTLDALSLVRVRYAAYLHRTTGLPVYISGGSPPHEEPPLGRLMAQVLKDDFGIEAAGVEDRSLTTAENAEFSAPMLRQAGLREVLLVTSAWHMPRSMEACARAGIAAIPAPTGFISGRGQEKDEPGSPSDMLPSMTALHNSYYAIHEYLGRAWYQVRELAGSAHHALTNSG